MNKTCDVRLNLALAWDRFGDIYVQLGYYQGAVLLYEASQAVLDDAGEECDPPPNQDQLTESKYRVEDKKQGGEDQRDQQAQPQGRSNSSSSSKSSSSRRHRRRLTRRWLTGSRATAARSRADTTPRSPGD